MAAKKQALFTPPAEYIACAFDGCPTKATILVRVKTGWANVCDGHHTAIVQKRAEAYCASLGLDTVAKQRSYVRQIVGGLKRKFTPPEMKNEIENEAESIPF